MYPVSGITHQISKRCSALPTISIGLKSTAACPKSPRFSASSTKASGITLEIERMNATATQRLARLYERKHAALEALKKSLLHQAFTGQL